MLKAILLKMCTPVICILSIALAPIGVSAERHYEGSNGSCEYTQDYSNNCCDPCGNGRRAFLDDVLIFAGSAAVGAIAGVVAANSSNHRGHTGDTGATGATGATGPAGPAGAGFVLATVPVGQPTAGAPVTSLVFTFTTLVDVSLSGTIQPYVTTPDGVTTFGAAFSSLVGGTSTVSLVNGPFYQGQYDVGVIAAATVTTLAGLVSVEVTNINGAATSPALSDAGIIVAAEVLASDTFFNAQYPFPQVP